MAVNIEFLKQVKIPYNVFRPINTTNSSIDINPNARVALLMQSNTGNQLGEPEGWGSFYDIIKLAMDAIGGSQTLSTSLNTVSISGGNTITVPNLYTASGSLTANRAVTLNAFNLSFNANSTEIFTISKPAIFRVVDATSIDFTGDGLIFDLNNYVDLRVGANRVFLDTIGLKLTLAGDLEINADAGTSGYVLMSNGAGFAPTWGAVPSSNTIYNADANLLGNRVVSMNTFNLSFTGSSTEQFNISGMVSASLQATTLTLTTGAGAGIQMAQHINLLLDPTSELRLNGSGGLAGQAIISNGAGLTPTWKAVSKINGVETSINYNAEDGDVVYGTVGAGGITVTLPDATGKDNMRVVVKQVDAGVGSLGVNTAGGNLEGVALPMLVPGTMQGYQFTSKGGHWWVTGAF